MLLNRYRLKQSVDLKNSCRIPVSKNANIPFVNLCVITIKNPTQCQTENGLNISFLKNFAHRENVCIKIEFGVELR